MQVEQVAQSLLVHRFFSNTFSKYHTIISNKGAYTTLSDSVLWVMYNYVYNWTNKGIISRMTVLSLV